MNLPCSAVTRLPSRRLLIALASSALLATGCSNLVNTAPSSGDLANTPGKIAGRVHGGNQPVAGATVSLYFASQLGIAKPATLAATTTTADDGAGSFSFIKGANDQPNTGATNTFSCPSTSVPYVYLVARGGNTLNTHDASVNNAASVFLAPVGLCSGITTSTFTYMSEAVTAATVAAVHQFINVSTGDIGADGTLVSYDALANAFNTVSNMVSLTTGQTLASVAITGPAAKVTVTASPEQAKLNQVANILSACINNATSAATACTTLFQNAVPPANAATTSTPAAVFLPATDVLQAAYYMFTNSTDSNVGNLTGLYNLSPASGAPYQPTLSAMPTDWSIGIQYTASGTCGAGGGGFISSPKDINIDGIGDIWIANGQAGNGTLSELASTGQPLACLPIPGGSRGGTIDSYSIGTAVQPAHIWIGDSEHNMVYRYTPGASPVTLAFPTTTPPYAMAADGNGNVFYSSVVSGSVSTGSVWIIPGAAQAATAVTPIAISTTVGTTPSRILVDGNNAIWASSQGSFVSLLTPTAGSTNTYTTTPIPTTSQTYGLAANSGPYGAGGPNGVYVSAQNVSEIDLLTGSGVTYVSASGFPTSANAGGLNIPSAIAVDGAQNVWATNDQSNAPTTFSVVSQFSKNGAILSPDGVAGGYQKATPNFPINGRSIAIDQAGNVWIGSDGSTSVTEIVGAAVPVFQPFALGLNQKRFQQIP